jgi:hypothetical protein
MNSVLHLLSIHQMMCTISYPGDNMGKTSWRTKLKRYHKIYEQVYANPVVFITDIAQNTGISRNTVAKYIKEMYKDHIFLRDVLEEN